LVPASRRLATERVVDAEVSPAIGFKEIRGLTVRRALVVSGPAWPYLGDQPDFSRLSSTAARTQRNSSERGEQRTALDCFVGHEDTRIPSLFPQPRFGTRRGRLNVAQGGRSPVARCAGVGPPVRLPRSVVSTIQG